MRGEKLRSRVNFRKAMELLKSLSEPELHINPKHEEFKAIITHWLQCPESNPIYGTQDLRIKWTNYLRQKNTETEPHFAVSPSEKELIISYEGNRGVPFPPVNNPKFTFIDLFAGIGGFRIPLQELGGKCIFSCDWDKGAQQTYFNNFGEYPFGDIKQFTDQCISDEELARLIPDHNILAAGFPCQPFSHAGVSARISLGKVHGFECETQGTLFFDIIRIAKVKQPGVLFLENVKHLKRHDGGKTFEIIRQAIEGLNYSFEADVIDSSTLVPQRRERCYMVCFRKPRGIDFHFPVFKGNPLKLKSILDKNAPDHFTISDRLWKGHIKRTRRNLRRGTGFTAFLSDLDKPSNTLVARYGKDGKECLIPQKNDNPRLLTPRECARLQGFPDEFILPASKTPAYRQFGNAVAVPVVKRIAEEIIKYL